MDYIGIINGYYWHMAVVTSILYLVLLCYKFDKPSVPTGLLVVLALLSGLFSFVTLPLLLIYTTFRWITWAVDLIRRD